MASARDFPMPGMQASIDARTAAVGFVDTIRLVGGARGFSGDCLSAFSLS